MTIVDPDLVQSHNVFASDAWKCITSSAGGQVIGNYKAKCAAEYCQKIAPQTQWLPKSCELADVGWGELMESDVIVTCTDSVISRMEAAYAARMLHKPMLDAGVMGPGHVGGRVALYAPHVDAACYSCGLSMSTRAAVLEHMASPSLSCAALPVVPSMGTSEEGVASACMTACRVVHQLMQGMQASRSTAWRVMRDSTDTVDLPRSKDCPWHDQAEYIALDDDRPIREALATDSVLLLPWPMSLTTLCGSCGAQQATPVRLSRLRQGVACSRCGASPLQPGQVVERICRDDAVAQRTPFELGLPRRSVLPVRRRIQTQRTD